MSVYNSDFYHPADQVTEPSVRLIVDQLFKLTPLSRPGVMTTLKLVSMVVIRRIRGTA
jgi:hypothetical protein